MYKMLIGAASAAFIGYCFYFDNKRRQDPDYKKKVHERRQERQQQLKSMKSERKSSVPTFTDPESWKSYFMQELQSGETKLCEGYYNEGIAHLANAVEVSAKPVDLLHVWQQTLPAEIFQRLFEELQERNICFEGDSNDNGTEYVSVDNQPEPADSGLAPVTETERMQIAFVPEEID